MMISARTLFRPLFLLLVALLVAGLGCEKKPFSNPAANTPPDTFISSVRLDPPPDPESPFSYVITFYGLDPDGVIKAFQYKIDAEPTAGDSVILATLADATTARGTMTFSSLDDTHTFYVRAQDDKDQWDKTPASVTLSPQRLGANLLPETDISVGPPEGGFTSGGLAFEFTGTDQDGTVASFQYAMDGETWQTVNADSLGKATISYADLTALPTATHDKLALGGHSLVVRAVDNLGGVDSSPSSRTFTVQSGFEPVINVTAGPPPGSTFFVASGTTKDFPMAWSASGDYYYGAIASYAYSFPDSQSWTEFDPELVETTLSDIGPGNYTIYIRAKDYAGNIGEASVSFTIVVPTFDKGILLVNGIHWGTYGQQALDFYEQKGPFGSKSVNFWDVFSSGPSGGYPSTLPAPLGNGVLAGDVLGQYSTLIWIGNVYQGDEEIWFASRDLVKSFLDAGGNVIFAARDGFGAYYGWGGFFDSELLAYAHIKGPFDAAGAPAVAQITGLVDMPAGPGNPAPIGVFTETDGDPTATVIFMAGDKPSGIWVKPTDGRGQFVYIGGRPYRYDLAASAQNYEYILTQFGE